MRYILLLTLTLMAHEAFSSPAEEPPDTSIAILESARELFGTQANFAANRLDSFFATERADDEFGRSRIRIRSQFLLRERAISDLNNQYRVNLKLPRLEQKFRYDTYADDEKKKRRIRKNSPVREADLTEKLTRDRIATGWLFNADIGVTAAIPPRLTTRARVRKTFLTGTLINRFVEQLTYVTSEDGLQEETQLFTDYVYTDDFLFRFLNEKRWQILQKEINTNHGPTWWHRMTENDAFIYGATFQTIINNGPWHVNNYRLSVNYRRNLYRQWIYFDVIPGLDFPKEWSFRRTPFIIFQLEVLFGT
ncbi:hypothetical protein ACJVC5_02140 [Peredibacter sp. HCB2-198]|uniref:hypothetical protein n=1 Tax=Peredibacter sp. HCB2-198 TaxID=3383025 RepID=UPI0038B67F09